MVVGSISYTVVSLYASTTSVAAPAAAPTPATATVAQRDADDEHHGHHRHHGHHGRRGGIVDAVRTALGELMPAPSATPAGPAAADTTPAAAPAAATPATPSAPNASAGADDFAHALWQALRDSPSSAAAQKTERRYGDLPQRLESLADSLDKPATAGATDSNLIETFGSMLKTLRGGSAGTDDARSLLAGFLHRIAGALGAGGGASGAAPTGQLVDTCA